MRILFILMILPLFGFAQDSKSWEEIATEHYFDKNYEEAIEYYQKWLEAAPNDKDNWYNLACCFALIEDEENALNSLNKAMDLDWNSCQHMQKDADLTSIHENEKFQAALNKCEENIEAERIPNYEEKHTKMASLGTYGVLLPENYDKNKAYPLVVWIHGYGSSEYYHAKYVDELDFENVIIVFPRAPYISKGVTESSGKLGWTAYQTDNLTKEDPLYMKQAPIYINWIDSCFEDAIRNYNINENKCLIFGHSQGAAYSLAYAMSYPEKVKASISFAGGTSSKFPITPELIDGLVENKVSIELLHGIHDPVVKLEWIEELYNELLESNVKVELTEIEAAHSFGDSEIAKNEIVKLIQSHL